MIADHYPFFSKQNVSKTVYPDSKAERGRPKRVDRAKRKFFFVMLTANSSPLKSGNNPIDAGPIYAGLIDADLLMSRPFWVLLGINRAWHQLGRYQLGWLQLGRHQLGRHQLGWHQSASISIS